MIPIPIQLPRLRRTAALAALAPLVLAGCATFSPDGGFDTVSQLSRERTGHDAIQLRSSAQADTAQARVADLLRQPLSADSVVAITLLNNRGLQARYAELGIAEADLVRASRPANPSFSFGRLQGQGAVEIDRAVLFDVLGLLTLPLARQAGQQRFERAQLQAAAETVALAGEARQAFFAAVAAQQLEGYFGQVLEAAEASSELALRMAQAGNFSRLAQLREQAFHADATAQLARARHQTVATRERLVRLLALPDGHRAITLPERLPDLPSAATEARDAEQTAMDKRLDLRLARQATAATAQALGLTQATRFINVLHAGVQTQSASGEPRRNGFEVELELPLFDFGSTRLARAEALYMQSVHQTAQVAIDARSEVRESYSAYRTAYDLARHYRDAVVPLRKQISDETLLRYNGMLASVFDLLADAREQIAAVSQAVEALRDHWVAESRLQAALAGSSPGAGPGLAPARAAATAPAGH